MGIEQLPKYGDSARMPSRCPERSIRGGFPKLSIDRSFGKTARIGEWDRSFVVINTGKREFEKYRHNGSDYGPLLEEIARREKGGWALWSLESVGPDIVVVIFSRLVERPPGRIRRRPGPRCWENVEPGNVPSPGDSGSFLVQQLDAIDQRAS
jgi:hypothetical protein